MRHMRQHYFSHTPETLGDVHWSDSHCEAAGRCDPPEETGTAPKVTQFQRKAVNPYTLPL